MCPECKRNPVARMGGSAFLDGLCGACWGEKVIVAEKAAKTRRQGQQDACGIEEERDV